MAGIWSGFGSESGTAGACNWLGLLLKGLQLLRHGENSRPRGEGAVVRAAAGYNVRRPPPENQMNDGRLLLHPHDPDAPLPSRAALLQALAEIGLLGAPLGEDEAAGFLVGEQFLQSITFMGCSPFIQLEPPADGGGFCHLALLGPYAEPRLLHGRNTRPPPCPSCGKRMEGWREQLAQGVIGCTHCGSQTPLSRLTWRRNAGFGRCFLEIRHLFPGEAVPVDGLLLHLEAFGAGPWDYFYLT
jgi:hypothetical protein